MNPVYFSLSRPSIEEAWRKFVSAHGFLPFEEYRRACASVVEEREEPRRRDEMDDEEIEEAEDRAAELAREFADDPDCGNYADDEVEARFVDNFLLWCFVGSTGKTKAVNVDDNFFSGADLLDAYLEVSPDADEEHVRTFKEYLLAIGCEPEEIGMEPIHFPEPDPNGLPF